VQPLLPLFLCLFAFVFAFAFAFAFLVVIPQRREGICFCLYFFCGCIQVERASKDAENSALLKDTASAVS
jgi:hypothetical protein